MPERFIFKKLDSALSAGISPHLSSIQKANPVKKLASAVEILVFSRFLKGVTSPPPPPHKKPFNFNNLSLFVARHNGFINEYRTVFAHSCEISSGLNKENPKFLKTIRRRTQSLLFSVCFIVFHFSFIGCSPSSFTLASETKIQPVSAESRVTTEEMLSLINNPPQTEEDKIKAWEKYVRWEKAEVNETLKQKLHVTTLGGLRKISTSTFTDKENTKFYIMDNIETLSPLLLDKRYPDPLPNGMEWKEMEKMKDFRRLQWEDPKEQKVYMIVATTYSKNRCMAYHELAERQGRTTAQSAASRDSYGICRCAKSEGTRYRKEGLRSFPITYDYIPCNEMEKTDSFPKLSLPESSKCHSFTSQAEAKGWRVGYPDIIDDNEPCHCYKLLHIPKYRAGKEGVSYFRHRNICGTEHNADREHFDKVVYETKYIQIPCKNLDKSDQTLTDMGVILNDDDVCLNCDIERRTIRTDKLNVHPDNKGKTFCGSGDDGDICFTCGDGPPLPEDEETEAAGVCINCASATTGPELGGTTSSTFAALSDLSSEIDDLSDTGSGGGGGSSGGGGFFSSIGGFFSSLFSPFRGLGALLFPSRSLFYTPAPVDAFPYTNISPALSALIQSNSQNQKR